MEIVEDKNEEGGQNHFLQTHIIGQLELCVVFITHSYDNSEIPLKFLSADH